MAIAERWMRRHYNWPDHVIIDHHIYAIVSDGDLQEGVSSEAASLAGTLKLGKLVYLYDDNDISIEGRTSIAFAENVAQRFQAYGWHVIGPIDGMDVDAVDESVKFQRQIWTEAEVQDLKVVEEAGVTIIRPDKQPFREAVRSVWEEFAGTPIGDLIARIQEVK